MKTKTLYILILAVIYSLQINFAQESAHSTGPIPKIKIDTAPIVINNLNDAAWLAFGHESQSSYTISMPIPAGTPFTQLFNWAPVTFASSMAANPQGLYYITETGPPAKLHQMTSLGEVSIVGEIIGMGTEKPNGIAYNWVTSSFYIASGTNLYSFNPVNQNAILIGPFNTGGNIIDLCFNEYGVCFAYDIVTDCAYTISISTGEASLLGPLGYDANFGQGMSYDLETQTIYLSAFNNSTFTGQLRSMNPQTGMTTLITDWGLIQLAPFAVAVNIPPPCPVGYPSNPNPPNGATNIPLTGNTATWTNGTGTVNVELWFGPVGNVVKVYDGPAVNQYVLPALNYSTTYAWYIVCKDAICGTQGPTWTFTTIQDPNLGFCDEFNNLNNWTIVGPLGLTNWSASNSSNAGGTPPELRFSWTPSFIGESKIRSVPFPLSTHACCYFSFNFYFDWFADPSGTVTVGITYDGGATSTSIYSLENPTGNVGPIYLYKTFGTTSTSNQYAQIEISYSGNSFNVDFVYWDNVCVEYLLSNTCPPGAPGNLTAQVIFDPGPKVQLGWQDNTWNEAGFNVLRKNGQPNDPGDYVLVGTAGQNQTQFIDATVTPESTYTYRVFAYNQFGQNGSNTATIAVPVPVELISFTAEVDGNVVTLFWQTATEMNNQGFEIERARLRSSNYAEASWERIGFVEGKGTTTEIQSYSFTDRPEPGKYKYRLKQIDYDGTFAYSPEVEAEVKAPNVFSLEQNYPNPFNPTTKIKYTIPFVETHRDASLLVTLKVYDILGNEVATLVNEEQAPGVYEVEFDVSSSFRLVRNLTSGIYFYQLRTGEFNQTKKMILLK